eukprot:COSAG06_NODE_69470_length_197_cov_77.704082_1_plen_48_part_10
MVRFIEVGSEAVQWREAADGISSFLRTLPDGGHKALCPPSLQAYRCHR